MTRETPAPHGPASPQECHLSDEFNREATPPSVYVRCTDPLADRFCEPAENAMTTIARHVEHGDWTRAERRFGALADHVDRSWIDAAKGGAT